MFREPDAREILTANYSVSQVPASIGREGRADSRLLARSDVIAPPNLIDEIRLHYRATKAAEAARISLDQQLAAFARVYLTGWTPSASEADRKKRSAQALRVIETLRKDAEPSDEDRVICEMMAKPVAAAGVARDAFEVERKQHRKAAERLAKTLPAWGRIEHVRGFSLWGLVTLIGEAGDLGLYSGCRKLYKRLGLAPDDCYPKGERSAGRMIPRGTRGRIMGIIADALLRAQWRGEKEDMPAHAIGPYGRVYGETKARKLAEDWTKGHADKLARRAMTKALIHDVHAAWHERELDYV